MTTRDRMVLIGVIVLVALAGGYLLVVSPERKQVAQAEAQVQSAQQQLESAKTAAAGAKAAEQRYDTAYSSVVRLGEAVPPATEVPSLIFELDVASGERNVNFASISSTASGSAPSSAASSSAAGAEAASATPAGFTQMPFTFVFKGSFEGLAHLLGQVDSFVERTTTGELRVSGRLLTIQGADITIENANGTTASGAKVNPFAPPLTATITATAYVLPASQGLTGGATPILPGSTGSSSSSSTTPARHQGDTMNEILQSLKSDLLDRRMLPIVVLLVVALAGAVAYTVLAGSGSSGTPRGVRLWPGHATYPGPFAGGAAGPREPQRGPRRDDRWHALPAQGGQARPLHPAPRGGQTGSNEHRDHARRIHPISLETKSSSSTGGSSTTPTQPTQPTKPTTPTKKPKPKPAYVVNLEFGLLPTPGAPVQLTPYELRARKQLPSASDPRIIFTGVHGSPFEAVFALNSEVIPKGEGICLPSTSQCESIELAAGKSEQLEYLEPTGQTVVYELKVISIARPEGASAARIARRRHHHRHHHG